MMAFDFDYLKDYDSFAKIQEEIDVPITVFLVGSRHPEKPFPFKDNIQIGNHSFDHGEWYEVALAQRLTDLMKNHEFLKKMYGVDCKVYRSPHLRNFPDTALEMVSLGYKPEMECAECPACPPMIHSHLKQYFSSHHYFKETKTCTLGFLEAFEKICQTGKDFTFFLDPHHFVKENMSDITEIIRIGKQYGTFEPL